LQHDKADDFVLATGQMHSVRKFVECSFAEVNRVIEWQGSGLDEQGLDTETGEVLVRVDPRYFRPTEVEQLLGDASKAHDLLGWKPTITFDELVKEMVAFDLVEAGCLEAMTT